jgi:two-component system, OmpR family, sensor kinase
MLDTIRARLTLWYVSAFGVLLILVTGLIYVLLERALYLGVDENLRALVRIAATSLANDLGEGQTVDDAARSTAAELGGEQMLAIYSVAGQLLAEQGRDDDVDLTFPGLKTAPADEARLYTMIEPRDRDDRHRFAVRRVTLSDEGADYVVVAGSSLERTDEELEALRQILFSVVPIGLIVAAIGGWFLARQSLSPVMGMAERARRIGVENISGRLPVVNPRDELGRLAETFNELLDRLGVLLNQQRQFMADASHELRTPVATARTAAGVALQQPHRDEDEYREALSIVEQQTSRLSRIVDDMFTLARADAGSYPVRTTPMYLDEVIDEVVRAARVLASTRSVSIELTSIVSAAFTGDEDLIRRLIVNVLDNAIRHAPVNSTVRVECTQTGDRYVIGITDAGPGIPAEAQPHVFERFFRADTARGRPANAASGAGLGLAMARWVARVHNGDVVLRESSGNATTFVISLPKPA